MEILLKLVLNRVMTSPKACNTFQANKNEQLSRNILNWQEEAADSTVEGKKDRKKSKVFVNKKCASTLKVTGKNDS